MKLRDATITDISSIAKIQVDGWKNTYRGIISDAFLDAMSYKLQEKFLENNFLPLLNTKNTFCFVAEEDAGIVVGFAVGGLERTNHPHFKGELYGIYILKEYQRKGLGRVLVQMVVRKLLEMNLQSMLVWVLAKNPFKLFYEKLGGTEISERQIEIAGTLLDEVAYGWHDIKVII
ncbi:MAG TPA: GNAT family N-acetyltransferase [Candidatus Deferrimicrobium sp.]|nr:GNAT family N-acetyltransferase [Candidatus Deferrimicrobium sp.]